MQGVKNINIKTHDISNAVLNHLVGGGHPVSSSSSPSSSPAPSAPSSPVSSKTAVHKVHKKDTTKTTSRPSTRDNSITSDFSDESDELILRGCMYAILNRFLCTSQSQTVAESLERIANALEKLVDHTADLRPK